MAREKSRNWYERTVRISKENKHFHHLGSKRSSQYQDKTSWITLCVIQTYFINFLFISQNAPQMCLLICNQVLQNRSLNCSCPWDCHKRRLSLRDDPKSHFKKDCTVLFHKNKTVEIFFGRFRFWKTLVCGLLCVEMQTAWQRWVWILAHRYTKGLSKAELSSFSI